MTLIKKNSRALGYIVGIPLVAYFILVIIVYLYDFQSFMVTTDLKGTPETIIVFIMMAVAAYAVFKGIEVIARTAFIFIFPVLLAIAGIILFSLINIKYPLPNLLPPFDLGKTLLGVKDQSANFSEAIVITVLLPFTKTPLSTAYYIGPMVFISILIAALVFALYGSLAETFVNYTYKAFELFRIQIRAEGFFIFIWVVTFFVKISVFFSAAVKVISDLFKIKESITIIAIAAFITFICVRLFSSYVEYMNFFLTYFVYIRIGIALALIMVLMALFLKHNVESSKH